MSPSASPAPDQLLELAREGDPRAMGELLELYRGYLSLMARLQIGRLLQGKVDAADLVQDTFLEAHRNFSNFRGRTEAELICWLRQILAATLANVIRRYHGTQRRNVRLERELEADLDRSSRMIDRSLVAEQSTPSQRAAKREQVVLLADALGRLPADYREVLILHHLEGLNFPLVAKHMGRTVDSVKNLWARALAQLRHLLGAAAS